MSASRPIHVKRIIPIKWYDVINRRIFYNRRLIMGYAGARIKYTTRITVCPRCDNKMRAPRRFGPAQVRCGRCGATLQTNLTEWADLSTTQKVLVAATEIILPSWIGVSGFTGIIIGLVTQFFLWAMTPLPLYLLLAVVSPEGLTDQSAPILLPALLIGPLLYPALLAVRLRRMIRESQTYTRTQEPPVWGKSAEKAGAAITVSSRYLSWKYQALLRLLAVVIAGVWFLGFSEAIWGTTRGYVILALAHASGVFVSFELSRCLGLTKGAYAVGALALVATPLVLPVLAILRHRAAGLIKTARTNLHLINRGRASQVEIMAYTEASRAITEMRNPTAVAPLIRALKDRESGIRETVATALGEIGNARAVEPLIQALQDKDSNVRAAAATALGKIGDPRAAKPIEEACKDQEADTESAATKAIEQLEQRRKTE
jgi:hypothetical protein